MIFMSKISFKRMDGSHKFKLHMAVSHIFWHFYRIPNVRAITQKDKGKDNYNVIKQYYKSHKH